MWNEKLKKESEISEYLILTIIGYLNNGNAVSVRDVQSKLQEIMNEYLSSQNGSPRNFHYRLSSANRLYEWIELKPGIAYQRQGFDELDSYCQLSAYQKNLLESNKNNIISMFKDAFGNSNSLLQLISA